MIAQCRQKHQEKRSILDGISLLTAGATLGLDTRNAIEIKKLQTRMSDFASSSNTMSNKVDVHGAQIVHLNEGQVRLGQGLKYTQESLNSTISRVNNIVMAVNALSVSYPVIIFSNERSLAWIYYVMYLARELGELKLSYQQSLLYSAMNDMLNNRPTLSYVHNRDRDVLIASVLNDIDLYINTTYAEYGLGQLLTEHLFFQHISFVSSKNSNTPNKDEIGRIVITNFFTLPPIPPSLFSVYEVKSIPHFHKRHYVRLNNLPIYVGQNRADNTYIEWYSADVAACKFGSVITCRDNQPVTDEIANPCLAEILNDQQLTQCHPERLSPMPHFVTQLSGSLWVVSINSSITCNKYTDKTSKSPGKARKYYNEPLSPVSIVNVSHGTTIKCPGNPGFGLSAPSLPSQSTSYVILQNGTLNSPENEIFEMVKSLNSSSVWDNLPYLRGDVDNIINFINQVPKPESTQ
ncbi:unnamed protein product [Didymodactylos carnosus]|uniref:Uncharacterized protein n=1 Tax=Didymodactylos carnosus TaxID=1234261 RepID=A0A8S2EEN7_9BILA|nr:unnamed protein product [Didymodactylos carnosus]CAF3912991.1 unnamed protein product [Didymodactylos carnosus]